VREDFVVDTAKPNAPTVAIAAGQHAVTVDGTDWYADAVSLTRTANGDPSLADGSDGSGVNLATLGTSPFEVTTNGASTHTATVKDIAGNLSDSADSVTVHVDAEPPTVAVNCPNGTVLIGSTQSATATASDGESGVKSLVPGAQFGLDTSTVGHHPVDVTATDHVGHSADASCSYHVVWPFAGFFSPVNMDKVNIVKAGSAVPVKFSLGGNRGLEILAAGAPTSQRVNPDGTAQVDWVEETIDNPGNSPALSYDAGTQRYQLVWKTSKEWSGTDRQLLVKLDDGTVHKVTFRFR
jgi:hypothetical protein